MKRFMKTLCALTLSFALCLSFVPSAFAITPKIELPKPVYQLNNTAFSSDPAAPIKISKEGLAALSMVKDCTIRLHFTPTETKSDQVLLELLNTSGNSTARFSITLFRDVLQIRFSSEKSSQVIETSWNYTPGEEYNIAFSNKLGEDYLRPYTLFINGTKMPLMVFQEGPHFLADLGPFTDGYIGGSTRPGDNAVGHLHSLQVYNTIIADNDLSALTHITPNGNAIAHMQNAIVDKDPVQISDDIVKKINEFKPKEGTFLIAFTPDESVSVKSDGKVTTYSLVSFGDGTQLDEHLHIYIDSSGYIGIEVRANGQGKGSYVNIEAPADVTAGTEHILAITADHYDGYKFYFDGALIYNMTTPILEKLGAKYQLFDIIGDINSGLLGATKRAGKLGYQFKGLIRDVRIWNEVLPEEELIAKTRVDTPDGIIRKGAAFSFEDWNTYGIRIPSLLLTRKGTLLAAGDIRFGYTDTSNDPPNNCDIGILRSTDLGRTWSDPKMLLNFLDYPNEIQNPLEKDSASYCDSLMVQGPDDTIYYFCDAMSGGMEVAVNKRAGTGMANDTTLKLFTQQDSFKDNKYSYTVKMSDDLSWPVLSVDGKTTDYTVDSANFDLYKSNQKVGNIFYYNWGTWKEQQVPGTTELRVLDTTFLIMMTSKDEGQTWSRPQIMNHLKAEDMAFFGTAPGVGYTIKTGKNAGRVLAPIYYDINSQFPPTFAAVIFKDKDSDEWIRGKKPTGITANAGTMGEIQIVEMPEEGDNVSTQLKMFIREAGGVVIATSYDGGETWSSDGKFEPGLIAPDKYSGCQQSVINYSKKVIVDGKEFDAVIFSNAAANARTNGTIRVGLINQGGIDPITKRPEFSFTWYSKRVIRYGEFGYSCLAELPNGNIGILYEDQSRAANVAELVYAEYTMDYLLGKSKSPELIYEASNIKFPDDQTDYVIKDADKLFSKLNSGTFIFSFTPTSNAKVQSLIGLSNPNTDNSHFHIYINTAAAVEGSNPDRNELGFEIRRQDGGDILKARAPVEIELGKQHVVAMSVDPINGYKLFFDGVCVYHMPVGFNDLAYGFISDIPNITAAHLGGTERSHKKAYPYVGSIDSVAIFDGALPDDKLLEITASAPVDEGIISKTHLFNFGDWNSPGLRIPSIIRTDNDVLIAAADIRFGNSDDPPNNCDIGIRTSKDGGATWSEPRMLLNFLDYPNEPSLDQPLKESASYCDSVLVKGSKNRVFLFVDAMKGNIIATKSDPGSGYITVNEVPRLALYDKEKQEPRFYVGDYQGDTAPVFTIDGDQQTPFSVGKHFELYEKDNEISNIFYLASPLQVQATVFSLMIYTDNDGQTWSDPQIMNPIIKSDDMRHCGTAPGVGIQIQNGIHQGRILVPYYYNEGDPTNVIMNGFLVYSDDNGVTWHRGGSPNDKRSGGPKNMGEIQVVEMPLGENEKSSQLKMFIRVPGHAEIATSFDGGLTWHPEVEVDDHLVMSKTSGCQMSVIRYDTDIDGHGSVIFSNPAATTRSNGAIQVGAIVNVDKYEDGTPKYGFKWTDMRVIRDGDFGYSCLVELENGNIGILYEEQSKKNSVDHLTYAEFTLDYIRAGI